MDKAQNFLEPIKIKYPQISYADLWILAANVGIEHTGGPAIGFVSTSLRCGVGLKYVVFGI